MRRNQVFSADIEDLGHVEFRISSRARALTIRVAPFRGVRVSVPRGVSRATAKRFVEAKRPWIKKHLARCAELESQNLLADGHTPIRTRNHVVNVESWPEADFQVRFNSNHVNVVYPESLAPSAPEVQSVLAAVLVKIYRQEARDFLPGRLAQLARTAGFRFNRVFIRNQKSRWGSCSDRNNINLNLQLMQLPDSLIDYVLLHELVHTEIKNHGPRFWSRLEQVCPGARQLSKKLRGFESSRLPLLAERSQRNGGIHA